ncbi:DUF3299 domain-containing protein [Jannaschia marina]|uniref:DUF3299 domain-containing protein n=1 Tax=Jannaschia marina TaxID=2741674 RepID=UPI0015C6C514|nr:DUF3299 domain-containing protein [Jannaschia marina]
MVTSRRALLAALAGLPLLPGLARAESVVDLGWDDLLPEGGNPVGPDPFAFVDHSAPILQSQQPEAAGLRDDWNGQVVRLPGFVVPIDYEGTGVTTFILVPFVGACVHVPPPPANQLVLVTTKTPYESEGLFAPVSVTGMFGTAAISTHLAEIGYALSAEEIAHFEA